MEDKMGRLKRKKCDESEYGCPICPYSVSNGGSCAGYYIWWPCNMEKEWAEHQKSAKIWCEKAKDMVKPDPATYGAYALYWFLAVCAVFAVIFVITWGLSWN